MKSPLSPVLPKVAARPAGAARLWAGALVLVTAALVLASCDSRSETRTADGRLILQYWEKWTGIEAEAMQAVVDKYNASQDRVFVEYLTASQMERKLLLATAGGDPPDVAGFWSHRLIPYSEMGALTPLNRYMERDGISRDDYLPVINEMCEYRGFYFGLPSTPACIALHYNKKLFREAGLDPERPPRTIAELDEYARKLTKFDSNGNITQMGFNPMDPGWWNDHWGRWFGASVWDGKGTITCDSPENVAAYTWIQSFPKEYGSEKIQRFTASGGQFASAQNLFIAGKLAMQLQGVWMGNFINKFNPDLEWAAAPFPAGRADLEDVTMMECDVLCIPKGAKHPEEAWQFIRFVQQQENIELLCLKQTKFSPLRKVSDSFYEHHPNPYIRVFRRLAESPNAHVWPKMPVYAEFADEMIPAVELMWRLLATPSEALNGVKARMQPRLDQSLGQWELVAEKRLAAWGRQ